MALASGQKLGPYEVVSAIGAGGMGEVYRATDTKLSRDVALKVLPASVARDADRMARFQREAQVLASLNHPHIASVYGLEESAGTRALVMELVAGPTLAERIQQGPLPFEEALPIAKQIAEALEYAHEHGIIHRDLKPANIKVTPDGGVKVLDFGLAKALSSDVAPSADASNSPTLSMAATKAGIILGTAGYMSPEQARAKAVDRRADIWAFGVVLYEMLTGRQAYQGETASDTLAKVLEREPDWGALPARTPHRIRNLLLRCLTKDVRARLRDIGEARIVLENVSASPAEVHAGGTLAGVSRWRAVLPWGLAGVLTVALGLSLWIALSNEGVSTKSVTRAVIPLRPGQMFYFQPSWPVIALSPDGSRMVTTASRPAPASGWQIFLRPMDQLDDKPLDGTENGVNPFFSPDGLWLGFLAGGKLKKVPVQGGPAVTLCDSFDLRGASWGPDGRIFFAPGTNSGIQQIPENVGTPKALTTPDPSKGETNHRWPHVLPGGKAVLFTSGIGGSFDRARIEVVVLGTGERRVLVEGGTMPMFVPPGFLVFLRGGTLYSVPFDPQRLEVTGTPAPVVEEVWSNTATGAANFAVSLDGTLVYVPGTTQLTMNKLVMVSLSGSEQGLSAPPHSYFNPAFAPDGRHVGVEVREVNTDIWVFDLARGGMTRLTFQPGEDETLAWTPDGRRVAYAATVEGKPRSIFWKNSDGSGEEETLWAGGEHMHLGSFSPDGKFLAFTDYGAEGRGDIWILPVEGPRQPRPFLKTSFSERSPAFSPDGLWIAYTSDESGRDEVYVQPFPGPGGKWQVSTEGGYGPAWARSGRELFYRNGNRMMAVNVSSAAAFSASTPRQLFTGPYGETSRREANYTVHPDGRRFLMVRPPAEGAAPVQVQVVTNWAEELKQRTPAGKK